MAKDKVSISIEIEKIGRGLEDVKREIKALGDQVKSEGDKIRVETGRMNQGFQGVSSAISSVKRMLVGLGAILAVKKLAGDFLDTARSVEQMQLRLKALLGDAEEGKRLFDDLADFAARVPFELREIMESATTLAGIMKGGREEIMGWMPLIADLAAVTNLDIQTVTTQIMRMLSAGAASADLFQERGVLAMLGFTAGVSYSAEETRKKLWEAWASSESRFRGATEDMAKSWDGMTSMLSDAWFQLRKKVMEAGVFDYLKGSVGLVLQKIDDLKEKGKLDTWAKEMAEKVVASLKGIAYAAAAVGDAFRGWEIILLGLESLIYTIAHATSSFLADTFSTLNKIPGLKGKFDSFIADLVHDADRAFGKLIEIEGKLLELPEANILRMRELFREIEAEIARLGERAPTKGPAPPLAPPGGGAGEPEKYMEMLKEMYLVEQDAEEAARQLNEALAEQRKKAREALPKDLIKGWDLFADAMDGARTAIRGLADETEKTTDRMTSFWEDFRSTFSWSLEAGFADLFKGEMDGIGDYFKQFCDGLINAFARAVAKMIADWITFENLTSTGKGGWGWISSLLGGIAGLFGGGGGYNMQWGGMYQYGGWINEPTLGFGKSGRVSLFGEAGPELVTPGHAISGARERDLNIYLVDERAEAPMPSKDDIVLVVSEDIQRGGPIRKTIKRFT